MAPQLVPGPGLDTVIPGPTPAPTRIRIELRYAPPGPARRGRLGSYRAEARLPVPRVLFTGAAQSGSSATGTRATRASSWCCRTWAPASRRVPCVEWTAEARGSAHIPPAPSRGKLQLIRFFAALCSDVFLFRLVLEGRVGSGKANTKPTRSGVGKGGCAGARPGAASEAPSASSAPAPCGPRGPAGRSAVVLAGVEARGRALQAAVAERRVLLGFEPQAG